MSLLPLLTAVLLGGASSPPAGAPIQQLPAPWAYVSVGDWTVQASADQYLMLTRSDILDDHVWLRFEFAPGVPSGRSERDLVEVDCFYWKMRKVQTELFEGPNLSGATRMSSTEVTAWIYPDTGTPGDVALEVMCDIETGDLR